MSRWTQTLPGGAAVSQPEETPPGAEPEAIPGYAGPLRTRPLARAIREYFSVCLGDGVARRFQPQDTLFSASAQVTVQQDCHGQYREPGELR